MKIFIYGAGVIGSYVAHELKRVGHDVTILARGKRYEELDEKGLVIRHCLQRKTTVDQINIVKELLTEDYYDAIIVVMLSSQIDNILPSITSNTRCPLVVFCGNENNAQKINERIKEEGNSNLKVLFGFFSVGGRRIDGKVISVHSKHSDFDIGSLEEKDDYKSSIEKIFKSTNFKIQYHNNIDDFFKTHIAFILPLSYLSYMTDCDLRKVARNKKALNCAIDAIIEGYDVLTKLGYKIDPEKSVKLVKKYRIITYFILKICAVTPLGKLGISDHCKAAYNEMKHLDSTLLGWIKESNLPTPNINILREYLIKYEDKVKN